MAKKKEILAIADEDNYKIIKSFEDACKKFKLNPKDLPDVSNLPEQFKKPVIAAYKLMIIYKAINGKWEADWKKPKSNEEYKSKYLPCFSMYDFESSSALSIGIGRFSFMGNHLCTSTKEKSEYIGKQFKKEFEELFF